MFVSVAKVRSVCSINIPFESNAIPLLLLYFIPSSTISSSCIFNIYPPNIFWFELIAWSYLLLNLSKSSIVFNILFLDASNSLIIGELSVWLHTCILFCNICSWVFIYWNFTVIFCTVKYTNSTILLSWLNLSNLSSICFNITVFPPSIVDVTPNITKARGNGNLLNNFTIFLNTFNIIVWILI